MTTTLRNSHDQLLNRIRGRAKKALLANAEHRVDEIKQALSIPSPPPSQPGEPPHMVSGALRDSIAARLLADQPYQVGSRVSANAEHADDLEFGTSTMAPRPFLRPDAMKARQESGRRLATHMREQAGK